jgi:hypothetical protein
MASGRTNRARAVAALAAAAAFAGGTAALPVAAPARAAPVGAGAHRGGPSAPSIGGFSAVPARIEPGEAVAGSYFRPRLAPGQGLTDEVLASNSSAHPVRLRVYPVDGLTGTTSGAVYSNGGQPLRGAGLWVTPHVHQLTLAPHAHAIVSVRVQVPARTTPGDHLAGVAFEDLRRSHSGGSFGVTQIVREVIGIEVVVPGPASAQIRLAGVGLGPLGGTHVPAVRVSLEDAGRLLCKPLLRAGLTGGEGSQPPVSRQLETILPGDQIEYPLPWPRPLSAGDYALAVTASGCGRTVSYRGSATLGQSLDGSAAAAFASERGPGFPWPWVAAGAAVALAFVLALLLWRRRSRAQRRASVSGHAPAG